MGNRAFSYDVTATMLMYLKGSTAILVYQVNPLGTELKFYVNMVAGDVGENALY